jgi:hypothetical protein
MAQENEREKFAYRFHLTFAPQQPCPPPPPYSCEQPQRAFEREAQQYAVGLASMNCAKQEAEGKVAELQYRLALETSANSATAAAQADTVQHQQLIIQQLQRAQQQLEADKQRLEQAPTAAASATCCVCMDDAPSVLYLPCKHYKVCEGCDDRLRSRDPCPVCRAPIRERITRLHL